MWDLVLAMRLSVAIVILQNHKLEFFFAMIYMDFFQLFEFCLHWKIKNGFYLFCRFLLF